MNPRKPKLGGKLVGLKSHARERRKRARGVCVTPHCRKPSRHQRSLCNTCRSRKYDDKAKLKFWNLKKSAKRRGISFALTWEWLCKKWPEYLKSFRDLHIDRKRRHEGYTPENVQLLDSSEHGSKTWAERTGWTWRGVGSADVVAENPF